MDDPRTSDERQPFVVRLLTRLNGEPPDPEVLERIRRRQERYAVVAKAEAVFLVIASLLLCAVAYVSFGLP